MDDNPFHDFLQFTTDRASTEPDTADPFTPRLFSQLSELSDHLRTLPRCRRQHPQHADIACQERQGHKGEHLARNVFRGILRWSTVQHCPRGCGLAPGHGGDCERVKP